MGERLTDDELAALEHQRLWSEDEQRLLLTEVQERRAAAEEAEMSMHARIRAEYDTTVAECWRAEVAKKDARIATLEAALRECVGDADAAGLFELGEKHEDLVGGSPEQIAVFHVACGIIDRANAALKGGG